MEDGGLGRRRRRGVCRTLVPIGRRKRISGVFFERDSGLTVLSQEEICRKPNPPRVLINKSDGQKTSAGSDPEHPEFLTKETTCTNVISKRTTLE
jgi:hypothetical protein